MKKISLLLFILCSVAACSGFKEKVGLVKYQPDEYEVLTNEPLSVPPHFNISSPEELAKKRSESQAVDNSNLSKGENLILQDISN